jgi:peptidoglycan/LPS O-acetylase OafA/YrhL
LFAFSGVFEDSLRWRFILPYTPFFAMGISTFWYFIGRIHVRAYFVTMGLLAVLAGCKFQVYQSLSAAVAALLMAFYRRPQAPLQFFGKISYSLYLFHFAIALRVVNYCNRFEWGHRWNWLIIMAGCAACVGLASLVYCFVERPSRDLSQRIRYRPAESRTSLGKEAIVASESASG